eukprot:TRINITY_DN55592_c0_g1_i1.p1 TRINITY_DN55592_c0_g1~~TRINITY_DN55592_c0_g1_i1.p1  ORF type:complete len:602 (+),score=210.25 TRINITY_DN55592_c0_g1_i1:105-1910(+)
MAAKVDITEDKEAGVLQATLAMPSEAVEGLSVDCRGTTLRVKSGEGFDVSAELPCPVVGDDAVAKYQKKRGVLVVTMPVSKHADAAAPLPDEDSSPGPSEEGEEGSPKAEVPAKDTVTAEEAERAEKVKDEGNKFFKAQKWDAAIEKYTEAININPLPAYLCNRAFAHLRNGCEGLALADANASLERDPKFVKAYYRKATAHVMLGKWEAALKDYRRVVAMRPSDPDALKKFKECEKEVKRIRFEKAIRSPDDPIICDLYAPGAQKDWTQLKVEDKYDGPRLDPAGITVDYVVATMEHFRQEKQLPQAHVRGLLVQGRKVLLSFPNVVPVTVNPGQQINVCGDIHGQFYDLLHLFKLAGNPTPTNHFLFNGDFVDRGSYGVEAFLTLLCWKLVYPETFFMSRGNHEGKTLQRVYGFEGELNAKLGGASELFDQFQEVFNAIPLAHVINKKVFVVHGGLFSRHGVKIEDINKESRDRELPETGVMHEMLWSDPHPMLGWAPSKRGAGVAFGPDVTKRFLADNDLEYVIRSHEVKDEGYVVEHDGKCITVFSAPNYCDQIGNKAAFITLKPETGLKPVYTQFEAQKHPGKKAMQYSRLFSQFQ